MSVETFEIVEPGMLTTVQDIGRYGYQRFGVPVSGAMDGFALRAANLLVGNDESAACLEITVLGPRIRFLADARIALAGGDLTPAMDGAPVLMWQSVEVSRGSVLSFKGIRDGMRAYLAVAGGIDAPLVMESRSTYLKGAIGGLAGRALRAKDALSAFEPRGPFVERSLSDAPAYGHEHELRVVLGPQNDAFTQRGLDTFLGSKYTVSMQSDRMGYRFDGPAIEHVKGPDIISDGTPLGAVQVPGDGKPIVLLADRGVTGGYTKIATVISADISKLSQAMPGDAVTFKAVEIEAAHDILRRQEERLNAIRRMGAPTPKPLSILVEDEAFEVVDERGEAIVRSEVGEGGATWTHKAKATVGGHTYEFEVTVKQVD